MYPPPHTHTHSYPSSPFPPSTYLPPHLPLYPLITLPPAPLYLCPPLPPFKLCAPPPGNSFLREAAARAPPRLPHPCLPPLHTHPIRPGVRLQLVPAPQLPWLPARLLRRLGERPRTT